MAKKKQSQASKSAQPIGTNKAAAGKKTARQAQEPRRKYNFPDAVLFRQAGRLENALNDGEIGPPVLARISNLNFLTEFTALLAKVTGAPAKKAGQMGDTATLTKEQNDAFLEMIRLMAGARRTGGLAFPGNDSLLRQEFKRGVHEPQGLGEEVKRARVILAACQKYATQLNEKGWIDQDTTDLGAAIKLLGGEDIAQEASKDLGPGFTAAAIVDLNKLYDMCLTVQNAARLQYRSTTQGNETPRARYLLGEFPPHGNTDTGTKNDGGSSGSSSLGGDAPAGGGNA